MQRIKAVLTNIFLVLILYLAAIAGILAMTELESSARMTTPQPAVGSLAQPISPQRDITHQQLAPAHVDPQLLPFWSR